MPAEATIAKAIDSLDRMAHIVNMERITKGCYVDPNVGEADGICGGHNYCAIGALWIGGGIRVEHNVEPFEYWELPGADPDDRPVFLRQRHGLRLAYEALNAAAGRYIERHGIEFEKPHVSSDDYEAQVEQLFERSTTPVGRPELLEVIADAKRALMAEVKATPLPSPVEVAV